MVIKVAELLLQEGLQTAILSRGYKRSADVVQAIDSRSAVKVTGDEPFMLFHHFSGKVPVVLSGNRIKGMEYILQKFPDVQIVVMDDGFQHRWIKPAMTILLTAFQNPFTADCLLPAGYLREPASSALRAQLIVVTKTPETANDETKQLLINRIRKYSPAPLLFATLAFKPLQHIFSGEPIKEPLNAFHCLAVSGISNDDSFINVIRKQALKTESITFPNHHAYTGDDARMIARRFNNIATGKKIIITTGKDAVKLKQFEDLINLPVYLLPVEHDFLSYDSEIMKTELIKHARKN